MERGRLGRRWENRKVSRITLLNRTTLREGREPILLPQVPRGLQAPQTLLTTPTVATETQGWGGRGTNRTHNLLTWGAKGGGRHVRPKERRM